MKKIITYTYNGIYIYAINDNAHKGAVKIGKFSIQATSKKDGLEPNSDLLRQSATNCIDTQTSRAAIQYDLLWAELALYTVNGEDIMFDDHAVHTVLENSGYGKRVFGNLTSNPQEWYDVDLETAKKAIQAVKDNRNSLDLSDFKVERKEEKPEIVFRKEQEDAIELALKVFRSSGKKVLWNAKMRFGKTLCALETIRRLGAKRTLLITHRPDVRTGWFTDFNLIKFGDKHFRGAKKVPTNNPYNLKPLEVLEQQSVANEDFKYLFFASIQDLRGAKKVGGKFDKNEDIFQTQWDYLIVDEAHEGTKTELGKNVIDELQKQKGIKTLYLSGTPYNILDDFGSDEIFTWDYIMEQEAKERWYIEHPDKPNPYEELPRLNIFTYNLGNVFDYRTRESEDYFNFSEFFRVSDGKDGIKKGEFVHKNDVKAFLDLLCEEGTDSNYPYSTEEYRFALAHTMWVIGGVKEGAALSRLINEHKLHTEYGYVVVNVAGDGDPDDEQKNNEALKKVNKAIAENERTITLTCGRLTTGVTVKEWSGVFMLAGSYNTRAATYLQTIFRCQSPSKRGVVPMKTECYAFDFAPDRTLVVIDEAIAKNVKGGTTKNKHRDLIHRFLNFCPVIAMDGSKEVVYDSKTFISQVNRTYADSIVDRGFSGRHLYNNLHTITDEDFAKLMEIGKLFSGGKSSGAKGNGKTDVTKSGLKGGTTTTSSTDPTDPAPKKSKDNKPRWERAMNVLNEISVRLPMMIFGLGINTDDLSIDYFIDAIDDESWSVFMPKGLSKDDFKQIKHLYNDGCLEASARMISERTQEADNQSIIHRVPAIANIIEKFRFPDKETVLTPWRVVNMHLADTVGGWCFYDGDYAKEISEPRFIDTEVSKNIFANDSKVLEINSKSGLYPLYAAYSLFRQRLEQIPQLMRTKANEDILWREVLKENLYVVCMSPMAVHITNRVLRGNHTDWHTNVCYIDNLTNKIKEDIDSVVSVISNSKTFNDNNSNNNMKFTAIVGNPPYQINDGGGMGSSAIPIYHRFVEISKQIAPNYISMIMPSRWFTGGRGLDDFRISMLGDSRIGVLHYYVSASDCFANVEIKGGICYLLWDKSHDGDCAISTHYDTKDVVSSNRPLIEEGLNVFVRDGRLVSIMKKVKAFSNQYFSDLVSANDPFGFDIREQNSYKRKKITYDMAPFPNSIPLYYNGWSKDGVGYVSQSLIRKNVDLVKSIKFYIPKAWGNGDITNDKLKPLVVEGDSCCTETYLTVGGFSSIEERDNAVTYTQTKFFHILVFVLKNTQNTMQKAYSIVPLQDFTPSSDIDWSKSIVEIDKQLYTKYGLSEQEIAFIESIVKSKE